MRKNLFLSIALMLTLGFSVQAQTTMRIYLIGNSVTDAINFEGFKALSESAGNTHIWARHVILGSPLSNLWNSFDGGPNKDSGYMTLPYGYPKEAFASYPWDAVSLQTYDSDLASDRQMFKNYITELVKKSPEAKVCVYSRWPRVPSGKTYQDATAQDWDNLWNYTYGAGGQTNEHRKYFQDLADAAITDNPGVNIVMIPVGEVYYELNKIMVAGNFPGCDRIWNVYSDGVHLNTLGNYIVSTTFFTTIYEQDPVGLSIPGQFSGVTSTQAAIIQQVVKQVVLAEKKYTKVEYIGPAPVKSIKLHPDQMELNVGKTAHLIPIISPANAANKNVTWASNNDGVASVSNGVVTANTTGSAKITATTDEGGYIGECTVTVINTGTAVNGVTISSDYEEVYKDETKQLSVTFDPATPTNTGLIWLSSDENIATVSQTGLVTALKKGSTYITAVSKNGAKADTCEVKVIVHNNPPGVDLRVSASIGHAPFTVTFDGSKSVDPDPDDFVLGFNWDIVELNVQRNSNTFDYTFTTPGTYTVTLETVDSNGATSATKASVTITVLDYPPVDPEEPAFCYEGFDYVAGPLHRLNGGRGWNTTGNMNWDVQNGKMDIPGFEIRDENPMKYKRLKLSGNYMIGGREYLQAARQMNITPTGPFADYISGGRIGKAGTTLWVSFLVRKERADGDWVYLAPFNGYAGGAGGNVQFGYFGTEGPRTWEMKIAGATVHTSGKPLTVGETALIVVKIEFDATSTVSMYVNPDQLGGNAPAQPDVTVPTTSDLSFSALGISPSSSTGGASFDEIRFGKTYADVTPYTLPQIFTLTVENGTVQGGTAEMEIEDDTMVTIVADAPGNNRVFDKWTSTDGIIFTNASNATTTFTMPAKNVTVTATYKDLYTITVTGGTTDKATATMGEEVTLTASAAPAGKEFDQWEVTAGGVTISNNKFTMGTANVTVEAVWKNVNYTITITGGTADKATAVMDEEVALTVGDAPAGKEFDQWNVTAGAVIITNNKFTVGTANVTVEAVWKNINYTVTVTGGTADKATAVMGEKVTITVDGVPGCFLWTSEDDNVVFEDDSKETTTFVMPAGNVTVVAALTLCDDIEDTAIKAISLYPNPVDDYFIINGLQSVNYSIIDITGATILSGENYNGESIDVGSLAPGWYIFRTESNALPFVKK